ncbi:MAG: hypothetical protein ABFD08_05975 [Syntrophomonas sp.]
MYEPQQTWPHYDKDGQAVPMLKPALYVVQSGHIERPATEYEQAQWTRWDELKANSTGIMAGLGFTIVAGGVAYRLAEKIGFNGWWGPLLLGLGTLAGMVVYILKVRKGRA